VITVSVSVEDWWCMDGVGETFADAIQKEVSFLLQRGGRSLLEF